MVNVPANDGVKPDRRFFPNVHIANYLRTLLYKRTVMNLRVNASKGSDHDFANSSIAGPLLGLVGSLANRLLPLDFRTQESFKSRHGFAA